MFDEVFQSRMKYQEHEDTLYHELTQPTEDLILERNKNLRNNPGIMGDMGKGTQTWARPIASIPLNLYEKAIRDGYDLNCKDQDFAQKELNRYLRSPEGKMCMIRED